MQLTGAVECNFGDAYNLRKRENEELSPHTYLLSLIINERHDASRVNMGITGSSEFGPDAHDVARQ
jgi:hypothetical protein